MSNEVNSNISASNISFPYKHVMVRFVRGEVMARKRRSSSSEDDPINEIDDEAYYGDKGLSNIIYTYFAPSDMDIEIDDYAIVYVGTGEHITPRIVQVVATKGIARANRDKANKIIAGVINGTMRDNYVQQMRDLHKYMDIRARLNEVKEQHDEFSVFLMLAQHDESVAKLLGELGDIKQRVNALPSSVTKSNDEDSK